MHAIPDAALDTHIGVLGRTGTGKSYTARGLVERLLGAKRQVVIVDPTGAWWGLRSLFPIPIFGGEHGDVAITDESGKAVAETILTHRTSAIIDLSMLARDSHAAMRRFMTGLVGRLKDRDPGALWLVIDEADEFLPQVLSPDMTRLFGDLKWIVRGRIAGWRVMMVTQRPQDIAKAVLTQIGTLVAHRLTAPQDRKAIEEWVKGHADEGEARQVLTTLASLQTGEAWAWSPDHGLLVRAVMPPIRSFDSGATPDADSAAVEQPELAAIDLSGIRATLEKGASISSTTNAGAKIDTDELARLCARVAELERERDEWTIERAYGQQQLDAIADAAADMARIRPALQANGAPADVQPLPLPSRIIESRATATAPPANGAADIKHPPRWQRILDALAWASILLRREAVERNIVAWLTDISPASSSYANDLGAMRTKGLIDYPAPGQLGLTAAGAGMASRPPSPPSKQGLVDTIGQRLGPRHRRLLNAVWNAGRNLARDELAERAGVSATSSSFANDLGKLRTLGLLDYPAPGKVGLGKVLA